ncbi:MAG: PD-(D/E)XK nuclease family protein [Candidatus Binatia bacterium]
MQQITQTDKPIEIYSYSRVTTFEQCPRRYRYRYRDGVKEAFRGVEGFMGQCVHEVLEWLFGEREAGRSPAARDAVDKYCAVWDERIVEDGAAVRVVRAGTEMESYRRAGAELVDRFHRDRFEKDTLHTVALEKHFSITLGGRHPFQGYIDRLARDGDGTLYIIDYKTGRRMPPRFEGKEADQLKAYAVAMFATALEYDADEIVLELDFLRSGRQLTHRMSRADVAGVEGDLTSRIDGVLESTVFPPISGVLCQWCGYNDLCDAYRPPGGGRARG